MLIPPSIYNAFLICPRQAWLMSRQMVADQEFTYLDIGRLISEESFSREKKEIYIPDLSAKIDMITLKDGKYFVAEIKKSSASMKSGIEQLKYYMYLLKLKGLEIKGMIKIPLEKKSLEITLNSSDIDNIEKKIREIKEVLNSENSPLVKRIKYCSKCAHYEFCFV